MPRLVRIDAEALSEVAIHLSLQKKYNIDVDLLDHMVALSLLSLVVSLRGLLTPFSLGVDKEVQQRER